MNEEEKVVEYLDNEILCKEFCSDYNIDECTKIVKKLVKKYHRLTNSCPEEPNLRITSRYEPIYSCTLPRQNNTMSKIDNHLDDVRDYNFMKEKFFDIMNMMNCEERACFTEMFMNNKTDYTVAKILGRSRCGLVSFINSSVVRVALAFHLAVMRDEISDIDFSKEIELVYY